jgi:hypothetical protein
VVRFEGLSGSSDIRSDQIHRGLARAAAEQLEPVLLTSSRHGVGVGSGRGVVWTCEELRERFRQRHRMGWIRSMRIVPLTGHISASSWSEQRRSTDLDAWYAADRLSRVCWKSAAHRIEIPFVLPDDLSPRERPGYERYEPAQLFADQWRLPISLSGWLAEAQRGMYGVRPTICIAGLGVLSGGHRLLKPGHGDEIAPIAEQLSELRELLADGHDAVGDLCNRLFVAEHPIGPSNRRISDLVDLINRRLITITDRHLDCVDTLAIVAGGLEKKFVINHALKKSVLCAKWLVTDADCAKRMLLDCP